MTGNGAVCLVSVSCHSPYSEIITVTMSTEKVRTHDGNNIPQCCILQRSASPPSSFPHCSTRCAAGTRGTCADYPRTVENNLTKGNTFSQSCRYNECGRAEYEEQTNGTPWRMYNPVKKIQLPSQTYRVPNVPIPPPPP